MKKFATVKILLLIFTVVGISPVSLLAFEAKRRYPRVYESYESSPTTLACSECDTANCGRYSMQVHAGIAPIIWTHRGEVDLLSCSVNPNNPVYQLAAHFPKFSTLYKLPWTIGGIAGYFWSDNVELYLELNYLQAKTKNNSTGYLFVFPNVVPPQGLLMKLGNYQLIDGYAGIRYYSDRYCDLVSLFVGAKLGFTNHRNIKTLLSVNGTPVTISPSASPAGCVPGIGVPTNNIFQSNTAITGGFNLGVDFCFCQNWSFVLTAEVVACRGPRLPAASVFSAILIPPTLATNLILGDISSEVRFPITFGMKYRF